MGGKRGRNTFGINQYLIYAINDNWAWGSRFEWWNVATDSRGFFTDDNDVYQGFDGNADVYALTTGLNYRPHANLIIRPEIRYDWVRGVTKEQAGFVGLFDSGRDQFTFGMDTILTF